MQDAELLIPLAEIAGVFVGFGALIAVRSGGPSEPYEISPLRAMVALGMLTIIAALAPETLGRYGLTGHEVWALSSATYLVGLLVMLASMAGTPEYRTGWAGELQAVRAEPPLRVFWAAIQTAVYVIYMLALFLLPISVLLGVAPGLEAALYFTVVVLILLGAGWSLLGLVFAQRRPASA